MNGPHLVSREIGHDFGPKNVLDLDHLSMSRGATAILGPNGSGKSTLLRLLATVTSPTRGTIRVDGLDPTDGIERTAIRRRLGYLAQDSGLPGRMRVHEYLNYVGALKEIGPTRLRNRWIHWTLQQVGLEGKGTSRIRSLSGGMQRRLGIAQALLGGPDLLVLDEPLTSLDAEFRGRIATLIAELAQSATVVVATHHADELAALCDRAVVLLEGRAAFQGHPQELAQRADGATWETSTPDPSARCRAVGPGRYRCIGSSRPPGAIPAAPSVADGYIAITQLGR